MFNLNEIIQSAQGGNAVGNLAQQFGISPDQAQAAVQALIPAISTGLLQKASSGGLGGIAAALSDPAHLAAFSSPGAAQSGDTVQKGSDVVDDLFGSSHITQQIAQQASAITGLRPDVLMQMLPVVVSIVLGGLAKSAQNQGLGGMIGQLASGGAQSGGIFGMLTGFLGSLFGSAPTSGSAGQGAFDSLTKMFQPGNLPPEVSQSGINDEIGKILGNNKS
ncbi:DUF937 domain-containing protein [Methylovirgula sp. HY1]|uniref:DUF937 domain-containing protein n=1 Tax=Methylovirgula sp. HY1 TaxID=2822761 RepID=UPI001C5A8980|nr:DUF937 domain-containing protein [Methylovirgula sp. HY1]QXX74406.1 hypothetical protein MHY1_01218 [Methylovirgula sp. HY1]